MTTEAPSSKRLTGERPVAGVTPDSLLALHAAGIEVRDVRLDAASLEDAYVRLTGEREHPEGRQS